MPRNRHHTKKGPGRVHWQGFERRDRQVLNSFDGGWAGWQRPTKKQISDLLAKVERYAVMHTKGVLGRIAKWRALDLRRELRNVKE